MTKTSSSSETPQMTSLTEAQAAEIDGARAQAHTTRRPTVSALEDLMHTALPVLDHGFVRVVDYMGTDAAIPQAARVSYGAGTRHVSSDEGLIRYLMRHWHSTPFEMCEIKFHVKLPIFVARQWIRHRTANVNEYSARYSILDREFYIPAPEHLATQSTTNNQGRGAVLSPENARKVRALLVEDATRAYDSYEDLVTPESEGGYGLARELARMNLPTNIYTQWYWKCDLHNLFHFLRLRADSHAQYEIRAYAEVIDDIVARWVPMAHRAYVDYRRDAVGLSRQGRALVDAALSHTDPIDPDAFGVKGRELREILADFPALEARIVRPG